MFPFGDRTHESPEAAVDTYRAELVEIEASIARLRARQVQLLTWLQGCTATLENGARSMQEWICGEMDVSAHTARNLMRAVDFKFDDRHPGIDTPDSFDRMVAVAGLARAGATFDDLRASTDRDIDGIDKQAALLRRVTRATERQVAEKRFFKIEPTMGNTAWRIAGLAPALDGDLIRRALEARGDELTKNAGSDRPDLGQRMLDALTTFAFDYLDPQGGEASPDSVVEADMPGDTSSGSTDDRTPDGHGPQARRRPGGAPIASVTVFIDAKLAEWDRGVQGMGIAAGPRIGPDSLDRIVCGSIVSIVAIDRLGNPTAASDRARTIPPAVRAAVLRRDGGCVIAGCHSRYRLEPHHIIPRSEGGKHHPDNLVSLCWFHHHVAIHLDGHRIDPDSPPLRRRFLPTTRYRAPPHAA